MEREKTETTQNNDKEKKNQEARTLPGDFASFQRWKGNEEIRDAVWPTVGNSAGHPHTDPGPKIGSNNSNDYSHYVTCKQINPAWPKAPGSVQKQQPPGTDPNPVFSS